jgi:hypothetical protein
MLCSRRGVVIELLVGWLELARAFDVCLGVCGEIEWYDQKFRFFYINL